LGREILILISYIAVEYIIIYKCGLFFLFMLEGIKLGIFDHSGVLSDDRKPVYTANQILLEKYGLPPLTFDEWLHTTQASCGAALREMGATASEKEIDATYAATYNHVVTRTDNPVRPEMYADAPSVLSALRDDKGIELAIVSSHPRVNLVRELDEYGISHFFDEISGDPMPKAQRLKNICNQFGVSPREAFFVEDTFYGLRSGKEADVNCLGVTTGYHPREALEREIPAVYVVDSLTDLLPLINP